jgi:hypothetical protein
MLPRGARPKMAKHPQKTLGGLAFERVSLAVRGGEMTYMTAVKRGYGIAIQASYATQEGLEAVEDVLGRISER